MKLLHHIKISVFAKEDEDEKVIQEKLLSLFPYKITKQLKKTTALGFFDKKITILEVLLERTKEINLFLEQFLSNLTNAQKQTLITQLDSRLDDFLHFFIRIDKDSLMKNNEFKITDSGNCFHIKMSVAAFPKKRSTAKKIVQKLILTQE
jgi:RNA binding exosome subunit